jgi:uncharacterized protein (TIGR02118 family)
VIKLFGLIAKRSDISDEQFHTHWATTHRDLAVRITALRRYVQSHRIPASVAGVASAPYEGIAEVWLDDVDTALGLAENPEYTQHAALDEPNFSDTGRHGVIIAREHVVRSGPPVAQDAPGIKTMLLVHRAGGIAPGDFAHEIAQLGPQLADELGEARRIVLAVPLAESYSDDTAVPPHDAVLEASFADLSAFDRAWESGAGAMLTALDAVAERSGSCAVVVEELRVIWP